MEFVRSTLQSSRDSLKEHIHKGALAAVNTAAPFKIADIEKIRLRITKEIGEQTFETYLKKIADITDRINSVITNDELLMKDSFFTTKQDVFWKSTSKWLEKQVTASFMPPSVSAASSLIVSEEFVRKFVGHASWMTDQQVILFKTALAGYFQRNDRLLPIYLNMDLAFQKHSQLKKGKITPIDLGTAALGGSGPFILKLLQQIGNSNNRHVNGIRIRSLLDSVFDNVPSTTAAEFEYIKSKMDVSTVYKNHLSPEVMGSASIAEAHSTKDTYGNPAVIKFIKPVYVYYFLCECDFLLNVVWKQIKVSAMKTYRNNEHALRIVKQTRQILLFLIREFAKEFEYKNEAFNTAMGSRIYKGSHLRSAEVWAVVTNPFPAIVTTKAPGKSLERVLTDILKEPERMRPALYGKIYTELIHFIDIWIANMLWGNGFFHADPHTGNIMCPDVDALKVAIQKNQRVDLWVIDYGSAGILTKTQQCRLIDAILISSRFHQMHELIESDANAVRTPGNLKPENIETFFTEWHLLSQTQQEKLRHRLKDEKVQKKHQENLLWGEQFVRAVWMVCDVNENNEFDYLIRHVLDYSEELEFGGLFLAIVRFGRDIGSCTNNSTLLFGRGIAYIGKTIRQMHLRCGSRFCEHWNIAKSIIKAIGKHPKHVINYLKKRPVCAPLI